jgi:hypothetical protein
MRLVLTLAFGALASGCYRYVPVNPGDVSPGQEVRVRLTAEEAGRYTDLRLREPRLMEGTLVQASSAEVVVEANIGAGDPTRGARVFVQQVTVPRSGILEVELREVDRFRTGLLVAGGGALLTVAIIKGGGAFGGDDGPGGEIPELRRIPLFRLRLPWGGW